MNYSFHDLATQDVIATQDDYLPQAGSAQNQTT